MDLDTAAPQRRPVLIIDLYRVAVVRQAGREGVHPSPSAPTLRQEKKRSRGRVGRGNP